MATFTIRQFINLLNGISLPATGSPHTATGGNAIDVREGQTSQINLQAVLNSIAGYTLTDWADLDLDTDAMITATIKYQLASDDPDFSIDHTLGVLSVEDVSNTELTLNTTDVNSDGLIDVSLSAGAISSHIQHNDSVARFFVEIEIDDGY